eukprot:11033864-Karenia_brevis.AAC.1
MENSEDWAPSKFRRPCRRRLRPLHGQPAVINTNSKAVSSDNLACKKVFVNVGHIWDKPGRRK